MAGFDFQVRVYVAELVTRLVAGDATGAENVLHEAIGDVATLTDDHLVCLQVKRTLSRAALSDAASEAARIDAFLEARHPAMRATAHFGVMASRGEPLGWDAVVGTHGEAARLRLIAAAGRLDAPRIVPDPWWRVISAVWGRVDDPFGFARFALERSLGLGTETGNPERVRNEIAEELCRRLRPRCARGQVFTSADFAPLPEASLRVGQTPTPKLLRAGQYMPRPGRVDALARELDVRLAASAHGGADRVDVVWMSGPSGAGKSVLLVQLLERLVRDGRRVVWLGDDADALADALDASSRADPADRPEFVLVDDLYSRDARDRVDLPAITRLIERADVDGWPVVVTGGPPEFEEEFRAESRFRGFDVHRWEIDRLGQREADALATWFHTRTGRAAARGDAFAQAASGHGLFVSMAVELTWGNLDQFAARFADRIEVNGLSGALRVPLALNRLYLGTPEAWFGRAEREALERLNQSGDVTLAALQDGLRYVRMTHPHLSDAIYGALPGTRTPLARANDLADAFERALADRDFGMVARLLRAMSSPGLSEVLDSRLASVDLTRAAERCARAWATMGTGSGLPGGDLGADLAVSWACWSATAPACAQAYPGRDPVIVALTALEGADQRWPGLWMRLRHYQGQRQEVALWAQAAVADPARRAHRQWSRVWELARPAEARRLPAWRQAGMAWLDAAGGVPDWHYVWRHLNVDPASAEWARRSGTRRVETAKEGPDWAFVLQDLLASAGVEEGRALVARGVDWLEGRDERPEWSYVWRAILERSRLLPEGVTEASLVARGIAWLERRDDRPEWSYVWRAILECPRLLPEGVTEASLVAQGVAWLERRDDRPEWAFVWRAVLERPPLLPEGVTEAALVALGVEWLQEREERPEWNYVWRAVLERPHLLPEGVTEATLVARGIEWLKERDERPEWAFVWQAVLERPHLLPEGVTEAALVALGVEWLNGRDERREWAHVWRAVLERPHLLPEEVTEASLVARGVEWLQEREERPEWNYVWRAVLERPRLLPEGVTETSLVARGVAWLTGRDDRAEWSHVWEALAARRDLLPAHAPPAWLFARGLDWLTGHMNVDDGPVVWTSLVRERVGLDRASTRRLVDLGTAWFLDPEHASHRSYPWVAEGLLDLGQPSGAVLARIDRFLSHSRHASTPITVAKRIRYRPDDVTASTFARSLLARLAPTRSSRVLAGILAPLDPTRLPPDVAALVELVRQPELFSAPMAAGTTVEGRVVEVRTFGLLVRIGQAIGLLHQSEMGARWPGAWATGDPLRVRVKELTPKGPRLTLADTSEPTSSAE